MIICCLLSLIVAEQAPIPNATYHELSLHDFSKNFFWQQPPEGMFEVNIGLQGNASANGTRDFDLEGQELMLFADINADMFTDMITVDQTR